MRALQHEEPRRVDADLVEQIVERDEVAPALGHRRALAALDEVHELQDRHLDRVRVAAERRHRRLELAHVGVVIGAHRQQLPLEAPLALVLQVGDVGGQVGGLAV